MIDVSDELKFQEKTVQKQQGSYDRRWQGTMISRKTKTKELKV